MSVVRFGARAAVLGAVLGLASVAGAQPANDDCANAAVISGIPFSDTVDVSAATEEAGDPDFRCDSGLGAGAGPPKTVWYRYTAPSAQNVVIRTFDSTYDTFMGAFRGSCGAFTELAFCNDDHLDENRGYGPSDNEDATLYMTLDAGESVYIVVADGENGAIPGTLQLDVQASPLFLADGFEPTEYTPRAAIGAGASGDFMVVWSTEEEGFDDAIRGRVFDRKGRSQGPVFDIATASSSFYPAVAGDGAGNFVVVWGDYGSPDRIMARRLDATGAPLGAPFQVNVGAVYRHPEVAADAVGNFVVSWNDGSSVVAQRFDTSDVGLVSDLSVGSSYYGGAVAMMPDGRFMVAWQDSSGLDGSDQGVAARRYDAAAAPLGSAFVVNAYTTGTQGPYGPDVAVTAAGDFLVVWADYAMDPNTVQGRLFDVTGSPQTGDFQVNTDGVVYGYNGSYGEDRETRVSVAADGAGEFVVAWRRAYSGPYGRRIDASGTPSGDEFQVSTFWSSYQAYYNTDIAATAAGDFMVVWHEIDFNTAGEVFGRAFPTDAVTTIGVKPTKLIVVDKLAAGGSAKVVYVSKDQAAGITKGTGEDMANVSARFDLVYDSTAGAFVAPAGALTGDAGWKVNKLQVAKYVNKTAGPSPADAIKVTVLKTGKLIKVVAKGLGDGTELDLITEGAPTGPVASCYEIDNDGERFAFGSTWAPGDCQFKEIAGGTGRKLVCKGGAGDATCAAAP